jgi:hypothetical protein
MTDHPAPPCNQQGNTVRRSWIIVRKPGCIPETKRPGDQTWEGVEAFLRELIDCNPEGTKFTLARLSYGFDLWVEDGHEYLRVGELMRGLDAGAPTCADPEPDLHF